MQFFENNQLIFSDARKYRLIRHLLFWGFWGLYFSAVRFFNPMVLKQTGRLPNLLQAVGEAFFMLLPQTILIYPLIYFILPRYVFKGKYIRAFIWVFVFLLFSIGVHAFLLIGIPWHKAAFMPSQYQLFAGVSNYQKFTLAYMASLQGSLTGAALAASFKLFKHYYVKSIRNQQLQRENISSQLQLLRAQVHPHFLFNTLNNIFSQTQTESPKGSKMIMALSDMLRYVLYEGRKAMVPLQQELNMIQEYINLEKIRYGNKLEVHVTIPEKTDQVQIAPLLMLPFVENCFKHGTSQMLQNPWLNLSVTLSNNRMQMKLMNSKIKKQGTPDNASGIGIQNARQRLELLYPDKYDLQVREDEEVFIVNLSVELQPANSQDQGQQDATAPTQDLLQYAK